MKNWILLGVALSAACTGPTAPTQTSGPAISQAPGGSIQVPGSLPSADDPPTAQVTIPVRDICTGGLLTSGANGGHDARPITLRFSGPSTFEVVTSSDDYVATLEYGAWTVTSTTQPATSGVSGYQSTTIGFHVPTLPGESTQINQLRECGPITVPPPVPPPTPPPPVTPPPTPVPPVPVPPPVPPTCQQANPPSYWNLRWDSTVEGAPIAASVDVSNEGLWILAIYASIDGGGWIFKQEDRVQLQCGQSAHLVHAYHWDGHPAQRWVYVLNGPGGIVVTGPIFTRP